jgi:hypothetical protein
MPTPLERRDGWPLPHECQGKTRVNVSTDLEMMVVEVAAELMGLLVEWKEIGQSVCDKRSGSRESGLNNRTLGVCMLVSPTPSRWHRTKLCSKSESGARGFRTTPSMRELENSLQLVPILPVPSESCYYCPK